MRLVRHLDAPHIVHSPHPGAGIERLQHAPRVPAPFVRVGGASFGNGQSCTPNPDYKVLQPFLNMSAASGPVSIWAVRPFPFDLMDSSHLISLNSLPRSLEHPGSSNPRP